MEKEMNAREKANERKILELITGSNLYGTATPESDKDFVGVFMPWDELVFGFERADEVDFSIKSKSESGRNDADAVDSKLYELRKFVKLSLENNPNIIEMLFANKENLIFVDPIFGQKLLDNKHLFPHKGLKQKFLGYAFSQKKKMVIRTDHFYALTNFSEFLNEYLTSLEFEQKLFVELEPFNLPYLEFKMHHVNVGDLNIQKHFKLGKVRTIVNERLSKVTNRAGLMEKYGYDTKFASHLLRLMFEGIELLKTGELSFPLKERELLLDVKLGKYKMTDVLKMSAELEKEVESMTETSELPGKPKYNEVQFFVIKMLKDYLNERKK